MLSSSTDKFHASYANAFSLDPGVCLQAELTLSCLCKQTAKSHQWQLHCRPQALMRTLFYAQALPQPVRTGSHLQPCLHATTILHSVDAAGAFPARIQVNCMHLMTLKQAPRSVTLQRAYLCCQERMSLQENGQTCHSFTARCAGLLS